MSGTAGSIAQQLIDNGSVNYSQTISAARGGLIGGAVGGAVFRALGAPMGMLTASQLACNLGGRQVAAMFAKQAFVGGVSGMAADAANQVTDIALGNQSSFNFRQMLGAGAGGASGSGVAFAAQRAMFKICFAFGDRVKVRRNKRVVFCRVEDVEQGEEFAACDENDPTGEIRWQKVEEVFHRWGLVLNLHLAGGLVLHPTHEHPFFVYNKGWTVAGELRPGQLLRTEKGWVEVEEVFDSGEYARVANFRVAGDHTYFVGDENCAVWAHNSRCAVVESNGEFLLVNGKGQKLYRGSSYQEVADFAGEAGHSILAKEPVFRGGPHSETSLPGNDLLDSHHMPAKSASPLGVDEGPAITMQPLDHQATSSVGSGLANIQYRETIQSLLDAGQWRQAMAIEIRDVRRAAQAVSGDATKYNGAMLEMLDYAKSRGLLDKPR